MRKVAAYPSLHAELTLRGINVADAINYGGRQDRLALIYMMCQRNGEAADVASSSSGQQVVVPLLAPEQVVVPLPASEQVVVPLPDAEAEKEEEGEVADWGSVSSESGESTVTEEDEEEVPLSTPMVW